VGPCLPPDNPNRLPTGVLFIALPPGFLSFPLFFSSIGFFYTTPRARFPRSLAVPLPKFFFPCEFPSTPVISPPLPLFSISTGCFVPPLNITQSVPYGRSHCFFLLWGQVFVPALHSCRFFTLFMGATHGFQTEPLVLVSATVFFFVPPGRSNVPPRKGVRPNTIAVEDPPHALRYPPPPLQNRAAFFPDLIRVVPFSQFSASPRRIALRPLSLRVTSLPPRYSCALSSPNRFQIGTLSLRAVRSFRGLPSFFHRSLIPVPQRPVHCLCVPTFPFNHKKASPSLFESCFVSHADCYPACFSPPGLAPATPT